MSCLEHKDYGMAVVARASYLVNRLHVLALPLSWCGPQIFHVIKEALAVQQGRCYPGSLS